MRRAHYSLVMLCGIAALSGLGITGQCLATNFQNMTAYYAADVSSFSGPETPPFLADPANADRATSPVIGLRKESGVPSGKVGMTREFIGDLHVSLSHPGISGSVEAATGVPLSPDQAGGDDTKIVRSWAEPAIMLFFGTGLAGLAGLASMRARRKR